MNCDTDRSANVMIGVTAGTHDAVEWVSERIKKWFRPPEHAPFGRELQGVIMEARDILQGFRSPAVESMSLEQALSCLRQQFPKGGSARLRIFVTGQPKALKPAIQEQIYLIGQEALINAFRHSDATSIEAEIEYLPRQLRILVRDNGRGIDPKFVTGGRHAHWGLVGMRERAAGIGAQFRIWSRLGAGTEVEISLPARVLAEAYA